MARAAANVQVGIRLRGEDRASKSINRTAKSTDRLSRSLGGASTRAQSFGSSMRAAMSGDVRGAVSGLKGAIGSGGVGLVGAIGGATMAAGALAAGVAVAAVNFTKWSVEIERTRAAMDHAFGPDGLEKAIDLSNRIGGVSAESVGKLGAALKLAGLNASFSVEQLQELTARATSAGQTGDAALSALAKTIQTGTTRSLKLVGTFIESSRVQKEYADRIGKTTTELTAFDRSQAVALAVAEDLNRSIGTSSEIFARQDIALARLDNAWIKLKATISKIASDEMVSIVESMITIIDKTERWIDVVIAASKLIALPLTAIVRSIDGAINAISEALEGRFVAAVKAAGSALASAFPVTIIAEQIGAINRAIDETKTRVRDVSRLAGVGVGARLDVSPRRRRRGGVADVLGLTEAETRTGARARMSLAESLKRKKPTADPAAAERKRAQAAIERQNKAEERLAAQRKKRHADQIKRIRDERIESVGTALSTTAAVVDGIGQMINAEKEMAAIKAILALAEGAFAVAKFGPAGLPQLAQGVFAAAQFALAAGKGGSVSPSSSASAAGASFGGGDFGTEAGGSRTVVYNFHGTFLGGTPQQLGKAINAAQGSMAGTGL